MIERLLKEREKQYGSFEGVAFLTLDYTARAGLDDIKYINTLYLALFMFLHKLARVKNTPESVKSKDSIDDMFGYLQLAIDNITHNQNQELNEPEPYVFKTRGYEDRSAEIVSSIIESIRAITILKGIMTECSILNELNNLKMYRAALYELFT